jgi:hypothetical protein
VGFVYSLAGSGLVIASQGADEAACRRALRQHDPDLRLVPQDSDALGRRVYKVYRYMGSERPAEFVCGWWDEHGNPYDLSVTGLLEMVQRHDRNLRGSQQASLAELEAKLKAERQADYRREADEIVREFGPRIDGKKSSPLPRSRGLYAARNRTRAKTRDPEVRP